MQKTKVRTDSHGLYVRTGGYVFRPYSNDYTYRQDAIDNGKTVFSHGQEVKAKHVNETPFGSVKSLDGTTSELWTSHGCYFDSYGKIIKSDLLWRKGLGPQRKT